MGAIQRSGGLLAVAVDAARADVDLHAPVVRGTGRFEAVGEGRDQRLLEVTLPPVSLSAFGQNTTGQGGEDPAFLVMGLTLLAAWRTDRPGLRQCRAALARVVLDGTAGATPCGPHRHQVNLLLSSIIALGKHRRV